MAERRRWWVEVVKRWFLREPLWEWAAREEREVADVRVEGRAEAGSDGRVDSDDEEEELLLLPLLLLLASSRLGAVLGAFRVCSSSLEHFPQSGGHFRRSAAVLGLVFGYVAFGLDACASVDASVVVVWC